MNSMMRHRPPQQRPSCQHHNHHNHHHLLPTVITTEDLEENGMVVNETSPFSNITRSTTFVVRVCKRKGPCRVLMFQRLLLLVLVGVVLPLVTVVYRWRSFWSLLLQPSSPHKLYYQAQLDKQRQATTLRPSIQPDRNHHEQQYQQHLPLWFVEYWNWHVQMRANNDELLLQQYNNTTTTKFLIVSIQHRSAGRLADRLRSLPLFVWQAAQTKRIFLMEWTRPCALEELLWPPVGGIDWTVPSYLKTIIHTNNNNNNNNNHKYNNKNGQQQQEHVNNDTIWYHFNTTDHMLHQQSSSSSYYYYEPYRIILTQPNHESFVIGMTYLEQQWNLTNTDLFWKYFYQLLLTPSPPVQQLLDATMKQLGLTSTSSSTSTTTSTTTTTDHNHNNNFWAIHLRARYPGSAKAFQTRPFWFSRNVDADGFKLTHDAKTELIRLYQHAAHCLYTSTATTNYYSNTTTTTTTIDAPRNQTITTTTPSNHHKLYFASDSNEAVRFVTQEMATSLPSVDAPISTTGTTAIAPVVVNDNDVVGMVTPLERFHLNRNDQMVGGLLTTPPMAFYPAIVDLWILQQAQCMAIGKGGYGLLAARMGGVQCLVLYQHNDFSIPNAMTCPPLMPPPLPPP